jgi:hypothetical protein
MVVSCTVTTILHYERVSLTELLSNGAYAAPDTDSGLLRKSGVPAGTRGVSQRTC